MSIRVLVADDQRLVRAGFRMILAARAGHRGRRRGRRRPRGGRGRPRLRPDVVLMDIRMPNLDGIEATRQILDAPDDPPRVLVLTTFDLDEYVYEALRAGASGFLLKDAPEEQLVAAIRVVADGGALFAPSVTRRLIEEFATARAPAAASGRARPSSPRASARCCALIAPRPLERGDRRRARRQRAHRQDPRRPHPEKLGLRDRVQAVIFAYESGLVRPGASD